MEDEMSLVTVDITHAALHRLVSLARRLRDDGRPSFLSALVERLLEPKYLAILEVEIKRSGQTEWRADRERVLLQAAELGDVIVGGGPFVTSSNTTPNVDLMCADCGDVALTIPKTAIAGQPSEELRFRCNACGTYGRLPG